MSAEASGPPPFAARLLMLLGKTIGVFFAGLAAAAIITTVWWRLSPSHDLDLLVYDQTVPNDRYPEHAVLDQLLEYHRVPFELGSDHVGAAPGGGTFGQWPTDQPDLIFFADVYGVYLDDDGELDEFGRNRATGQLTHAQTLDVQRWVENGTPAYGEFAMVTSPTPADAAEVLEEVFQFTSTGWTMTWVEDLEAVSPAIQSLGPDPWPFSGSGLLAIHVEVAGRPSSRQLIVIPEALMDGPPEIVGGAPGAIAGRAPFERWLSVVEPSDASIVDASFELSVDDEVQEVLEQAGIPLSFPALVRTDSTIYFAGDGLDDTTPFRLRRLRGGAVLTRLITGSEYRFVYMVLEPAVGWLIEEAERLANQRAAAD